jgi:membrane associated rhomboid family serine protease
MIPLQDVIATRQLPLATLVLIVLNLVVFMMERAGLSAGLVALPFSNPGAAPLLIGMLWLWLFGDNVEARLGRMTLVTVYGLGGWLVDLASTGGITAVMGSYFVLFPRSRVLTLVPFPPVLMEVPAAFFLGVWTVLHLLQFVSHPATVWMFALAFGVGASVAGVLRRPVQW